MEGEERIKNRRKRRTGRDRGREVREEDMGGEGSRRRGMKEKKERKREEKFKEDKRREGRGKSRRV